MTALKGLATNGRADLLGNLNMDWMHGWCEQLNWLPLVPLGVEVVPHLFRKILTPEEMKSIIACPGWKGYLILFNEPDLEMDLGPTQVTQTMMQQMSAILNVTTDVKFIIAAGTQDNALFTEQPYLKSLWPNISKEFKQYIKGFHTHLYPQWQRKPCTFQVARDYFQAWRNALDEYLPARELWVTEYGVWDTKYSPYDPHDNEWQAIAFAAVMRAAANGFVERIAWFSDWLMLPDGYHYAQEHDGSLTNTGKVLSQI